MEDDAPLPQKKFYELPKPKHAEEYSLEECAKFQPWKVILKVEADMYDLEPIDYEIFLRAQSPDDAQWTAYQAFMIWEHKRPGIPDNEYPQISTRVQSEAYKLRESDWKEFWKEAQHYPHTSTGDKRNPSIFRFAKPGWDKRARLIKNPAPSIIVPDKATIDAIKRTKPRS